MSTIERQRQILVWIQEEEVLKVSEISRRLNVSEMTIYRDLKPLLEQKKIVKTSNGIAIIKEENPFSNLCSYCYKSVNSRSAVQLIKKNLQIEQTCCIHCGLLRFQDIQTEVSQIICRDYLHDTTISAKSGYFLIDPDLHTNCCKPQVITFQSMIEATKFQKGFGGEIYDFQSINDILKSHMQNDHSCH